MYAVSSPDFYAFLLHCVAVADCYAAVLLTVKIVGDAKRRADFVLAAVAFADRARVVKFDAKSSWTAR